MKLFLASTNPSGSLETHFSKLVGKPSPSIKLCLIENAADPYPEEVKGFLHETRSDFQNMGIQVEHLDLREYDGKAIDLQKKLKQYDVVWLGGGNVYYLRWILEKTGADLIIHELVKEGLVYGGGSAGAIVAGPTLQNFQTVDDPTKAPQVIEQGLGLTDVVIIPHWDNPKYQKQLESIREVHSHGKYPVVTLTDDQALVIETGNQTVVG